VAYLLIADPELAAQLAADPICRWEGHEVVLVPAADELLSLAARRRPDLVILPDALPERPGLACARALRDRVGQRTLIALTARELSPALVREAVAAGCDKVVPAPLSREGVDELLKLVVPARTQDVRVPVEMGVEVHPGRRAATARNLSRHGMRLDLAAPLAPGERLALTVVLPPVPTRVRLEAVVVWSRPTAEGQATAGVRFEKLGRLERETIDAFIVSARTGAQPVPRQG
jgi:DNA-binding response OmpR family regulator